jgi:hypothetical protein
MDVIKIYLLLGDNSYKIVIYHESIEKYGSVEKGNTELYLEKKNTEIPFRGLVKTLFVVNMKLVTHTLTTWPDSLW